MACDPSHVGHASKLVSRMHIKHIFDRKRSPQEVATGCMDDALRFTRGTRGLYNFSLCLAIRSKNIKGTHIKNEKRVLRRHDLKGAIRRDLGSFLVPPFISSISPRNRLSGAFENKNVLDFGALLEGSIDNGLGGNRLSTALAFVGRDYDTRITINNSLAEGLCAESCKDDRVDGANACACEEGCYGLPSHWKVDGDGITLADTKRLEYIGNAANFTEELAIGDVDSFVWLISLPDDSDLYDREVRI